MYSTFSQLLNVLALIHINLIDKQFNLNVHFDYYSDHEFHKQVAKSSKNIFYVIHTNIQSSNKFDIVAVSETWNPNNKTVVFKPGLLEGYILRPNWTYI